MIPAADPDAKVVVVGHDPEVAAALHLGLEAAGWPLFFVPSPEGLEGLLRQISPAAVVLLLPAEPDASWGGALTVCAAAASYGMRIVVVAPSREVVEPLAAVAGAEAVLSRADVLAHPAAVLERAAGAPRRPLAPVVLPPEAFGAAPARAPAAAAAPRAGAADASPPRTATGVDLAALIDEELVDEPHNRPRPTRVEVNVSLVSEHQFYVGHTRRIDSGGVFISTALPPPVGTLLQVRLGLADGRKLELEGEVAFIREKGVVTGRQPPGCGVRLRGLPGWALESIATFLQARPPMMWTSAG